MPASALRQGVERPPPCQSGIPPTTHRDRASPRRSWIQAAAVAVASRDAANIPREFSLKDLAASPALPDAYLDLLVAPPDVIGSVNAVLRLPFRMVPGLMTNVAASCAATDLIAGMESEQAPDRSRPHGTTNETECASPRPVSASRSILGAKTVSRRDSGRNAQPGAIDIAAQADLGLPESIDSLRDAARGKPCGFHDG